MHLISVFFVSFFKEGPIRATVNDDEHAMSFAEVQDSLRPPAPLHASSMLGRTFKHNQPDVEVVGILVRDVPTRMDAYSRLKGKNDWCSLQLVILGTSGPGFSSVPYTSTKRKDEREVNPQPLYDVVPHSEPYAGLTRLYTYEKGRSNKDKGRRVELMQGVDPGAEQVCASAVLPAGITVSAFLREDSMNGDFFLDSEFNYTEEGILPANTLVRAVVSAANVDQAQKGMLLKIKKIKPTGLQDADLAMAFVANSSFPASETDCERLHSDIKTEFPAIARSVYGGNVKFFAPALSSRAFADPDEATGVVVLVDPVSSVEITVPAPVALETTGACNLSRAAKIMSIAVSQKAMTVIARTNRVDDVIMDSKPCYTAIAASIDVGRLLGTTNIVDQQDFADSDQLKMMFIAADPGDSPGSGHPARVIWFQPENQMFVNRDGYDIPKHVVYELELDSRSLEQPAMAETERFLADNVGGLFLPLRMYEKDINTDLASAVDELDGDVPKLIALQIRPEKRGHATGRKRKRFVFVTDDLDF